MMHQHAVFFRNDILGTESQQLPAKIYNALRQLIRLQGEPRIFLPIRSLQSMAVISTDEVMFVDIHMRKVVEFSWQNFKSQQRAGIDKPVAYEFVWHNQRAREAMQKAPDELMRVMTQRINSLKDARKSTQSTGRLITFTPSNSP